MIPAWVLYARCSVTYNGRASSVLESGNYLIIYKPDGSLSIHGSTKIVPRNYQSAGSVITRSGNKIISTCGKEVIEITVEHVHWEHEQIDWSGAEIKITRTERELVQLIINDPEKYLRFKPDSIHTEYPTEAGPVDIVAISGDTLHVIEVKRRPISLNNCVQLGKYVQALAGRMVKPYVAGPGIGAKAVRYCAEHGYNIIYVNW